MTIRLGILGGGQLGKMLCLAGQHWDLELIVLDPDPECPAHTVCHQHIVGDFRDHQTVIDFGKHVDILTIEIEDVSLSALEYLQQNGLKIYPDPSALEVIQDKGLQKDVYKKHGLPTAQFQIVDDAAEIKRLVETGTWRFPFVQKLRRGGYDGKGVFIVRNTEDLSQLFDAPSVLEEAVDIASEIAIIVAHNGRNTVAYPPVEMDFHPTANLVEFLISPPINLPEHLLLEAENLAKKLIEIFGIQGLLAVEMFVTVEGKILINEVAPRLHNSGHHTIEANYTSQFEQHLRAILSYELGDTALRDGALMMNVLGSVGYTGNVIYEGLEDVLALPQCFLHLYSKKQTQPFRKMGHITLIGNDSMLLKERARSIQSIFHVISS